MTSKQKTAEKIQFSAHFVPAETFHATVEIPVLGRPAVKVKTEFVTMTAEQFASRMDEPLIDFLADTVKSWEQNVLGVEFSREALEELGRVNSAAHLSILQAYQKAIYTGQVGN